MRYNQVAMPEVDEKTNFYSVRLELVSHVDEKANFNSTIQSDLKHVPNAKLKNRQDMSNGAMLMRNPNFNAVRLEHVFQCQIENRQDVSNGAMLMRNQTSMQSDLNMFPNAKLK